MIKLNKYGIVLSQIQVCHIEMLREWRNRDEIRRMMQKSDVITSEQQKEWFQKINENHDLYFIYEEVGVVHLKNIEWNEGKAEAGIFASSSELSTSIQSIKAILVLMDFAFGAMGLKTLEAKVKDDNKSVIDLNLALGYEFSQRESNEFCRYQCFPENYTNATAKWHAHFSKMGNEKENILHVKYSSESMIATQLHQVDGFLFRAEPLFPL
ncbi:MAG: GNAT family N-acetyltransferase [Candidatus Competibacteraceae bacterium]|nr:GNAT family N-acetyltransferase [Candidatus Competibacteraceae bacterium]